MRERQKRERMKAMEREDETEECVNGKVREEMRSRERWRDRKRVGGRVGRKRQEYRTTREGRQNCGREITKKM